jgi:hypothetical protein
MATAVLAGPARPDRRFGAACRMRVTCQRDRLWFTDADSKGFEMTSSQIARRAKIQAEIKIALKTGNIPLAQSLIAADMRLLQSVYGQMA